MLRVISILNTGFITLVKTENILQTSAEFHFSSNFSQRRLDRHGFLLSKCAERTVLSATNA